MRCRDPAKKFVSVTCGIIECMFEWERMSDPEVIARFDELMERCYPSVTAESAALGAGI